MKTHEFAKESLKLEDTNFKIIVNVSSSDSDEHFVSLLQEDGTMLFISCEFEIINRGNLKLSKRPPGLKVNYNCEDCTYFEEEAHGEGLCKKHNYEVHSYQSCEDILTRV